LDFSFKKIKDLNEIIRMDPRKGKRKAIPILEPEPKEEDKLKKL